MDPRHRRDSWKGILLSHLAQLLGCLLYEVPKLLSRFHRYRTSSFALSENINTPQWLYTLFTVISRYSLKRSWIFTSTFVPAPMFNDRWIQEIWSQRYSSQVLSEDCWFLSSNQLLRAITFRWQQKTLSWQKHGANRFIIDTVRAKAFHKK